MSKYIDVSILLQELTPDLTNEETQTDLYVVYCYDNVISIESLS